MKKSVEILEKIEEIKNEMKVLKDNGDVAKAHEKVDELKALRNEYEIEVELEAEEVKNIATKTPMGENKAENKIETKVENKGKVFNSAVKKVFRGGKTLTPVENSILQESVGSEGGYLLPIEFVNHIEKLRRQFLPLKQYCRVIPVSSPTGNMPIEVDDDSALVNFTAGTTLTNADISFNQVAWNLASYGKIIPISANLLDDETINLPNFIGYKFAKASVLTENAKILEIMGKAQVISSADYTAITQALNKELDPAISSTSCIFTNQDGFDYLDELKDTFGRPLLNVSLADATQKMYKGRPVVVLSNAHMPSASGVLSFYVGDLSSAVAFFDRGLLEMASSVDAGFTSNTVLTRCIERFDVEELDTKAIVCVQIAVSTQNK